LTLRLEAWQEEELRVHRFDASMTAYLMNSSGRSVKTPVSADLLLGIGKQELPTNGKRAARLKKTREEFLAEAKRKGRTYAQYEAEQKDLAPRKEISKKR
jgi:hypothetical protein